MSKITFFTGQPIFTQLLKFIPKDLIKRLAKKHGTDYYYKKFDSYHHLIVMLFASFQKCNSLRELISGMLVWQNKLLHLGIKHYPCRSTLSDANGARTHEFFEEVYFSLLKLHKNKLLPDSRLKKEDRLYIIDSSTFELFSDIMLGVGANSKNGKRKGGVKAHMMINAVHLLPEICYFSNARENDRIIMDKVSLPAGSILVFDKGYAKFSQWQQWTIDGLFWVTRMNKNASYEVIQKMNVGEAQLKKGVISDEYILLGRGTTPSTEQIPARRIVYYDKSKNRIFAFVTNAEHLKPFSIAALYKRRWLIETNFKAIKQNFQLRYFLGNTPNAIKIQLWCALIADLLIRIVMNLAHKKKKNWAFSNLCALIRMHLATYVNIIAFLISPIKSLRYYVPLKIQYEMKFDSS